MNLIGLKIHDVIGFSFHSVQVPPGSTAQQQTHQRSIKEPLQQEAQC